MAFLAGLIVCLGLLHSVKLETTLAITEEPTTTNYTTDESISTTTCIADGTSCNLDNVTTVAPPTVMIKKYDDIGRAIRKYKPTTKTSCSCDLQHRFCDINCCCDKDCSYEDKLVFKTCDEEEDFIPDTKFCKYMQYIYQNRTLYEWEMTQNSLFCIVKSNLPQKYIAQEKQFIKNKEDVKKHKERDYNWPHGINNMVHEIELDLNFNYSYGDPIWAFKDNQILKKLELPNNFVTHFCNLKTEIKFLIDSRTECTQSIKSNIDLNVLNYVGSTTILSEPYLFSPNFTTTQECPKNICIPLDVKICDATSETCTNDTSKLPQLQPMCRDNSKNGQKSCINFVQSVSYTFYHNGTYGFTKVGVVINLKNFIIDLSSNNDEFKQIFEVKFLWNNYTLNYSDYTSGNPGYIYGKPILIADHITHTNMSMNATTNKTVIRSEEKLARLHNDYTKNFFILPVSKRGKCLLTNDSNLPIEFGYNMITKCVINKMIKVSKTADYMCRLVQNAILAYWSMQYEILNNTTVNKTVGKYGNSNGDKLSDWSMIMFEKSPEEILNSTFGKLFDSNTTLSCLNISTMIKIDFFHAREEHGGVYNQEKIIATFVEFANPQSFKFKLVKDSLQMDVPIRSEVMFHDITSKQVYKFVEPPSLDIKLPFDFFYPFVKVNNSSVKLNISYILIALCAIISSCVIE